MFNKDSLYEFSSRLFKLSLKVVLIKYYNYIVAKTRMTQFYSKKKSYNENCMDKRGFKSRDKIACKN